MFLRGWAVELSELFKTRASRVQKVIDGLEGGAQGIVEFTSSDLKSKDELIKIHNLFPHGSEVVSYLYRVELVGATKMVCEEVRSAFCRFQQRNEFKLSRFNDDHPASECVYVGTSQDMFARFRSHIGVGTGGSTYGLYLSKWAQGVNTSFRVEYSAFKTIEACDMELIEGVLWDSRKPMFGKKGGK